MKKFKCPYCKNESFSLAARMFTGGMASKGRACPDCGKHAVHGMKATVTDTVIMAAAFVFIFINYRSSTPDIVMCLIVLAVAYLVCRIINGLFFELTENNRRDVR